MADYKTYELHEAEEFLQDTVEDIFNDLAKGYLLKPFQIVIQGMTLNLNETADTYECLASAIREIAKESLK